MEIDKGTVIASCPFKGLIEGMKNTNSDHEQFTIYSAILLVMIELFHQDG